MQKRNTSNQLFQDGSFRTIGHFPIFFNNKSNFFLKIWFIVHFFSLLFCTVLNKLYQHIHSMSRKAMNLFFICHTLTNYVLEYVKQRLSLMALSNFRNDISQ